MVRKIFRSISKIILVLFTLMVIFSALLSNSFVQTYLARIAAIHLSEYLDSRVKIDRLSISAFFTLNAKGIEINDLENEPLIHVKRIYLTSNLYHVLKSDLAFNLVEIDSARVFIRKYAGKEDLNIINILNKFRSPDSLQQDTTNNGGLSLRINQLEITNSHFIYQLEDQIAEPGFGMDYNDLDVQDIQAYLGNISILKDSINAQIYHLSAIEKSGFDLNHMEGNVILSSRGMELEKAELDTPTSSLGFDLNFAYDSWQAFNNFNDDVSLKGEIKFADVNMGDIAFFAPEMEGMDNQVKLTSTFNGPVRNLRIRNIDLGFGSETSFKGNLQMRGLPKIYETFISLRVADFSTSLGDIQQFRLPGGMTIEQPSELLRNFGKIGIKGNFTGFYNDFVSNAVFQTNIGQLTTDIQFSNNPKRDIIEYRGDFKARQFDLGRFLKREDYFGKSDFDLQVKGEGLDIASLYANVNGQINSFEFKNNRLEDIAINGLFQERQFKGDISINDELIRANFKGHIDFDSLVPVFNFELKLAQTHLALLGILPVDSSAVFASDIKLNFRGNTIDNIRGEIRLDTTSLIYKDEYYLMNNLQIKTTSNPNNYRTIHLLSDFVDGDIDGVFLLSEIKNTAVLFLHRYLPNIISASRLDTTLYTKNVNWDIRIKNLSYILPLFEQPLQLSENSRWEGNFDVEKNTIASQLNMQSAVFNGIKFKNLQLKIYNTDKLALNADLAIDAILLKEEQKNDSLQLSIDNLRFSSLAKNDSVQFLLNWNNKFKAIKNKADIAGFLSLSQASSIDLKFKNADLIINDTSWHIHPENRIIIEKNKLLFEKMGFYSGGQLVEVTGAIDQKNEQALKVNFNNFDVSNFDILLKYKGVDLDGLIDGDIQFLNIMQSVDFLADLKIKNFRINKETIGNVSLNSNRNLDKSIFMSAQIVKELGNNQNLKSLVFEGLFYPERHENSLDFSLYVNQLPFQVLTPFLYQWVDRLDGDVSGSVFIHGTPKRPDLKGNIQLNNVGFRIIYLNTDYTLTAKAEVDNSFIDLRDADFRDEMNNRAMIYGGLFHDHLADFGVDISIAPQNFMGLNTVKGMNSLFYGKAFATGSVEISGPFDDIEMNINVATNKGSDVVIPINLTADISDNGFIIFVNPADTLLEKLEKKFITEPPGFSLNMDLSLNPSTRLEIILPEELGNIQSVGYGDLNMNLSRDGNFTMAGDYQVSKGTFLFRVKNVYKKRFDLVDGGTISWTGDPYAGELNMKAIYHVKTSLNTLGTTQDDSFRTRVPVDCIIGLKDQILNPTVKFSFEFPNSSEEVKQLVFSQIDTTNEAVMSQQMLSLLVLNSFSFSSATGNLDFASNVGGSSLQFVANQLGNWLSQISNDVDVGIKYRPGGVITNEEVEVALSTQLFDERVTIDGNFGYQSLNNVPATTNASNIVGDLNVEVKMGKDGRFRLKAFNHTNTVDIFNNIAPYTQGVGVFYRQEFNFFRDLLPKDNEKKKDTEVEPSKILPDSVGIKPDEINPEMKKIKSQ